MNALWLMVTLSQPVEVYTVDLARAVLATPEGKVLAAALESERRAIQTQLQQKEAEVLALAEKDRQGYLAQLEAHLAAANAAEAQLEATQEARLAPLLAQLKKARPTPPGTLFLWVQDHLTLGRPGCDRSSWWVTSNKNLDKNPACQVTQVFEVELARVFQESRLGRHKSIQLTGLETQLQAELDAEKARLAQLEARQDPGAQNARRRLDKLYQRHQDRIKRAEAAAEQELWGKVEAELERLEQRYPGNLWVEKGGAEIPLPRCDGTSYLAAALDGETTKKPQCANK